MNARGHKMATMTRDRRGVLTYCAFIGWQMTKYLQNKILNDLWLPNYIVTPDVTGKIVQGYARD